MLHDTQRDFVRSLFALDDDDYPEQLSDGRFPARRLLQVYRNNMFSSLTGALRAVFPVVEQLVGEGFFRYAADSYIRRHPSRGGNLHDFGSEFATFLGQFPAAASLAYLPEVARLEWAWHRAFHAATHPTLDADALAAVPLERHGEVCFSLHPSAHLLDNRFPVLAIWQRHQPGYAGGDTVHLGAGGDQLLVIRPALTVEIRPLTPGDYALLHAFAKGATLDYACDCIYPCEPSYDLPGALRRFIQDSTLVTFCLK
jgi:hypothetical protein